MSDKSTLCRDFIRGACTRGSRCRFQHSDDVLAVTSCIIPDALATGSRKRKLQNEDSDDDVVRYCRDFQRGQCRRVPGCCRYVHEFPSNDDQHHSNELYRRVNSSRQSTSPYDSDTETYRSEESRAPDTETYRSGESRAPVHASGDCWLSTRDESINDDRSEDDILCRPITSDSLGVTTGRRAPICRDYLKGVCQRSTLCKYRHLTLDQYTDELLNNTKTSSSCRCLVEDRAVVEDRLKLVETENALLRKRVAALNNQLKHLGSRDDR